MIWPIQSVDPMKCQQDNVRKPLSLNEKVTLVGRLKELGVTHFPISVPYDTPPGLPSVDLQNKDWVEIVNNADLEVWHRHSWCSDEGFYDVPHNNGDDMIAATINYIHTHSHLFRNGQIFTPKPEPQNCRIFGVNWGDWNTARFKDAWQFNDWLRNMAKACKDTFVHMGLPNIKVGYWGFDGFITCGYNNPDHQGRSVLEKATVDAMEDGICVDHYPPSGTTMTDFIKIFKQTWPDRNLIIGEYGAKGLETESVKKQINETLTTLKNEPIVKGLNYWPAIGGIDAPLLDSSFNPILGFNTVRTFFKEAGTPPNPDPMPPTTPGNEKELLNTSWHLEGANGSAENDQPLNLSFMGYKTVEVALDLHGATFGFGADEASIIFIQDNIWHMLNIAEYGMNGFDGTQKITFPLDVYSLDLYKPISNIHARFWNKNHFVVDIRNVKLIKDDSFPLPPEPPEETYTVDLTHVNFAILKKLTILV